MIIKHLIIEPISDEEIGEIEVKPLKSESPDDSDEPSDDESKCVYNCNDNGGYSVAIKTTKFITGNTLGSCFSQSFGGKCSGIPDACENCLEKCEGKDGQEFSEIVDV